MDEAKALQQHQQQQMMLQHRQQQQQQLQQQQQQMLLLQQIQHQKQQQQQHQQSQQNQHQPMSRFPSNMDVHFRPNRPINPNSLQQQQLAGTTNPNPNPNSNTGSAELQQLQAQAASLQQQQQLQQQRMVRPPAPAANQVELQMAYGDAWRVCHADYKRPFASIGEACERLLPYHVVADYEAEEDDRILDSDTTGQMISRSQQWDNNIAAKVAEFTGTFEKQVYAFNLISRKRSMGEFRAEERLMIEQALLQEEKRAIMELRNEIESREKAGQEADAAKMRMAAMAQASHAQSQSHAHAEMMARGPIRASALGSHSNDVAMGHDLGEQEHGGNPDGMMNGWGHNGQRDEEPTDDFLNDEENENGDAGDQDDEWRGAGEFDLNTR